MAAAIAPRGVCGQLLQAVLDERYALVTCPSLLAELDEVLRRPKLRRYLSVEEAQRYVARLAEVAEHSPDPVIRPGLTRDPDDDYLVALAQEANADYLVSGDRDLTVLTHLQPPVLEPRAFLEHLNAGRSQ